MDVYHKVLARLFEITGGRDNHDVDLVDLLKREGFYPSIDNIKSHLSSQSWITEPRPNVVRITHWGVMEAKRGPSRSDASNALERNANRLLAETKEFVIILEEFAAKPSGDGFSEVEKKFGSVRVFVDKIRDAL